MDVFCLAKKLYESILVLIKKAENIERRNGGQAMPDIRDIKNDLIKDKEIAQQMIKEIKESVELNPGERRKLEEQIRELQENEADNQKRIARLEKEILRQDGRIDELSENLDGFRVQLAATETKLVETQNELSDTRNLNEMTVSELKRMENALKTGQVAFDFEKDLATYIYPHDKKFGTRKIFTQMKRWLKEKKETIQGREANERWNALQEEFSWTEEHERVFFKLLESRKEFAHPVLDRNEAQSQIPDDYTDDEKRCIEVIVNMVERVNILMQQ